MTLVDESVPTDAIRSTPRARLPLVVAPLILLGLYAASGDRQLTYTLVIMLGIGFAFWNVVTPDSGVRHSRSLVAVLTLYMATVAADVHVHVMVAVVAITCSAILPFPRHERPPRGLMTASLFFGVIGIASIYSPDTSGLRELLLTLVASMSAYLLAGLLRVGGLNDVWTQFLALCALEATLAVAQLFIGFEAMPDRTYSRPDNSILGEGIERAQGTLGHPLLLGLFLTAAIALALWRSALASRDLRFLLLTTYFAGLAAADARSNLIISGALVGAYVYVRWLNPIGKVLAAWAGLCLVFFAASAEVAQRLGINAIMAEGSYSHRLEALRVLPRLLFEQPVGSVLLGNGNGSVERLFAVGLLQSSSGFLAVDNQIVTTLAVGGALAAALLLLLTYLALTGGAPDLRPAVLALSANYLVFDTLAWPASACLTFLVLSAAAQPRSEHLAGADLASVATDELLVPINVRPGPSPRSQRPSSDGRGA